MRMQEDTETLIRYQLVTVEGLIVDAYETLEEALRVAEEKRLGILEVSRSWVPA